VRHLWTLGLCLVAVFAMSAVAAMPALAETKTTEKEWQLFANCPLANPLVDENGCINATSGGASEFTAGNVVVPLKKPITLNLGFHENEETGAFEIFGAEYGHLTMTRAVQPIPGGLTSEVNPALLSPTELARYEAIVAAGKTKTTATVELAGSIHINEANLIAEEGTAMEFQVMVHLQNPFLGKLCYEGSNTNPINIAVTTGTTTPPEGIEPIKGTFGEIKIGGEGNIIHFVHAKLVNNTYVAPGVSNCGVQGGADEAIDSAAGLPSAAGHNKVLLEGLLSQAGAQAVKNHLTR
jgi:hypothetical protein